MCVGGQRGELLAEGTKQGRSEGGNRKMVMPLQSEEFSWAKTQLKYILCSLLKKPGLNNPGLPGINPASAEGTVGRFYKPGDSALPDRSHTCISDVCKAARALQGWFIPSLIFVLRWKHF